MENRLNPGVLLDLDAQALRAHACRGTRRVRHVDGVDAEAGQKAGAFDFLGAVDAFGGNDFNQRDEGSIGDEGADAGTVMERRGRRLGVQCRGCAGDLDARLGVNGAHGRAHGADVVGRGAAAAAYELRSGGNGLAGEAGHVLGRTEVNVAAFDCPGHAGIGHCRKRQSGGGAHGFNGGEYGGRAGGAVDADGSCAPFGEQRGGLGRRCAVEAVALVVDSHHDQDGQFGSGFAGGSEGLTGLVQRGHGFEDEHVDAGLGKGLDLLGKGGASFVEAGFAEGLESHAQGTDGACHPGFATLLFFEMRNRLASQIDASRVDFSHFSGQAMASQAKAVGAEGVGFKNFGAGLEVLLVDGEDEARVGEIEFVVAAIDEDAAGIEHRAHGSVGQYGTAGKDVGKLGHALVMLSHAATTRQSTGRLCYTSEVTAFINRAVKPKFWNPGSSNLSDGWAMAINVFTPRP